MKSASFFYINSACKGVIGIFDNERKHFKQESSPA